MCPFQSTAASSATFVTPGTLITPGSVVATLGSVVIPGLCGNYTLTDANGATLASGGGGFGAQQTRSFCLSGGLAPLWHSDEDYTRQLTGVSGTDIQLVPNPVQDILTVYYALKNVDDVQISVIDITGKAVRTNTRNANDAPQVELDVNDLTPGFYFVRLVAGDTVIAKKFVKQ